MALRALMLGKQIRELNARLDELRKAKEAFATREAELATAIEEANTEEEQKTVEAAVATFESEKVANDDAIAKAEEEQAQLEQELSDLEKKQEARSAKPAPVERKVEHPMNTRNIRFAEMTRSDQKTFVERDDVREFLVRVREFAKDKRAVTGGDLLFPDTMLSLIRLETVRHSKLLSHVNLKHIKGTARQSVMGEVPEAIWTEMVGALNEISFAFNAMDMDGYKLGAFIPIPNATLEDSDIDLAGEIISVLGISLGKGADRSIVAGTGSKQPVGIKTRLAQTSKPADWDATAPEWTNLSASNVITASLADKTGAEFFAELVPLLGVASPKGATTSRCFWVMNRKTHLDIMAKALAFNSAAALVAQNTNTFPIVGGEIIEDDDLGLADYEILGGFGDLYLMVERAGVKINASEHARFVEDQTVFKGTARYDGAPIRGEAFVDVTYGAEG